MMYKNNKIAVDMYKKDAFGSAYISEMLGSIITGNKARVSGRASDSRSPEPFFSRNLVFFPIKCTRQNVSDRLARTLKDT